ncbi:MAG: hypothetical protein BroJett011_04340 [Chloroflexota bacterium]|nr:MAG: hypothetical protein BroJett011_04340 [Chloroflexota bacterium]
MTTQIALDGGFGNTKIAWKNGNGRIHVEHFPSVVGLGQADLGLLTTGLNGRHRQVKPFIVEWDGLQYLAGPNIHRWSRPVERLDFQRLYEGPEAKALTYAALSRLFPPSGGAGGASEGEVSVLAGFPVEILQDRARGLQALAGLKSWLVGRHAFCVDGRAYTVTVRAVKAMAQPLGSYFLWGLDEDGRWIRPVADFDAPVAVADIGFNTLDLFGIERGQVVSRLTGGQALGMHRAATAIKRYVRSAYQVELSLSQADELIREHVRGREALVHHLGATAAINPIVQQALDECFAAINEFLREHFQAGSFRTLLLTGGGAEALRKPLLKHYPAAVCLPEPVCANANGLARYARKLFKADTPMPGA